MKLDKKGAILKHFTIRHLHYHSAVASLAFKHLIVNSSLHDLIHAENFRWKYVLKQSHKQLRRYQQKQN